MLIQAYPQFWSECHWEVRKEVGSLSPAELLARFETGTFQFQLQQLHPLGHSPWCNVGFTAILRLLQKKNYFTLTCSFYCYLVKYG